MKIIYKKICKKFVPEEVKIFRTFRVTGCRNFRVFKTFRTLGSVGPLDRLGYRAGFLGF